MSHDWGVSHGPQARQLHACVRRLSAVGVSPVATPFNVTMSIPGYACEPLNLRRWGPRIDDLTQGNDLPEVVSIMNGQAREPLGKRDAQAHFLHQRLRRAP